MSRLQLEPTNKPVILKKLQKLIELDMLTYNNILWHTHVANLDLIKKEYIKMSLVQDFASGYYGCVILEGGFYSDRKLFADFRCFLIAAYFITHSQLSY